MQVDKPIYVPVKWMSSDELKELYPAPKVVWSELSNPLSWDTDAREITKEEADILISQGAKVYKDPNLV